MRVQANKLIARKSERCGENAADGLSSDELREDRDEQQHGQPKADPGGDVPGPGSEDV
jgi:hypothetical protein